MEGFLDGASTTIEVVRDNKLLATSIALNAIFAANINWSKYTDLLSCILTAIKEWNDKWQK